MYSIIISFTRFCAFQKWHYPVKLALLSRIYDQTMINRKLCKLHVDFLSSLGILIYELKVFAHYLFHSRNFVSILGKTKIRNTVRIIWTTQPIRVGFLCIKIMCSPEAESPNKLLFLTYFCVSSHILFPCSSS